jgi:hypothetical protein
MEEPARTASATTTPRAGEEAGATPTGAAGEVRARRPRCALRTRAHDGEAPRLGPLRWRSHAAGAVRPAGAAPPPQRPCTRTRMRTAGRGGCASRGACRATHSPPPPSPAPQSLALVQLADRMRRELDLRDRCVAAAGPPQQWAPLGAVQS